MRLGVALLCLMVGLAGCGVVPQPFSRDVDQKAEAPPLFAPATEGVVILPTEGVDEGTGALIADLTAQALQKQGIIASAQNVGRVGNSASLYLAALGTRQSDGAMRLDWTLARPDGSVVGEFSRPITSDEDLLAATRTLAGWIEPRSGIEPGPGFRPKIAIGGVHGASGDGDKLLGRALAISLARSSVDLDATSTEASGPADAVSEDPDRHVVRGQVTIDRLENGADHVKIAWVVSDGAGREVGVIDQENQVPAGSLNKSWGAVAQPIADGAAEGIVVLLRDAEKRRRLSEREPPNGDRLPPGN
ncbi:MAG: hypothetical protein NXI19_01305 [Alphaproteobacteria bacterium]|nr:hypothetical protein [Alphaproteobacteria bacterium]